MACNKSVQELEADKVAKAGDTMTGILQVVAGTAAAPGLAVGEDDTGLFRPAADTLGFAVGGGDRGRLTDTSWVLGPNNSDESTNARLVINKSISASTVEDWITIAQVQNNGDTTQRIAFKDRYGTGSFANGQLAGFIGLERQGSSGIYDFIFGVTDDNNSDATEKMRFTSGGNLLIGTTSDDGSNKLQVNGNAQLSNIDPIFYIKDSNNAGSSTSASGKLIFRSSDDTEKGLIGFDSGSLAMLVENSLAGDLVFRTNGNNVGRFSTSGRLGLGIDNPAAKIDMALATENLRIVDAGSTSATEQDWIEVQVGGVTGYIRVHATK